MKVSRKQHQTQKRTRMIAALLSATLLSVTMVSPGVANNLFRVENVSASNSTSPAVYQQRTFTVEAKPSTTTYQYAQNRFPFSRFEPTGIYARNNQTLLVKNNGSLPVTLHMVEYKTGNVPFHQAHRAVRSVSVPAKGSVTATAYVGSMVYLECVGNGERVSVNIVGGEHIPVFEKGVHTDADFAAMIKQYPNAPFVEYVGEHSLVTASYNSAKKYTKQPSKVMETLDDIVILQSKKAGLSPTASDPKHQMDPHFQHLTEDRYNQVYMYATYEYTAYASAYDAIQFVLDYNKLTTDGWGPYHEIGHTKANSRLLFKDMTEVVNNVFSMEVADHFKQASRLAEKNPRTGKSNYDNAQEFFAKPNRNFDQYTEPFDKLVMLWQLDLSLGKNFYPQLYRMTRDLPAGQAPTTEEAKKQMFMINASKVANINLLPFFDQWGMHPSQATRSTIQSLGYPLLTAPIWNSTDRNPIKVNTSIPPVPWEEAPVVPPTSSTPSTSSSSSASSTGSSSSSTTSSTSSSSSSSSSSTSSSASTSSQPSGNTSGLYRMTISTVPISAHLRLSKELFESNRRIVMTHNGKVILDSYGGQIANRTDRGYSYGDRTLISVFNLAIVPGDVIEVYEATGTLGSAFQPSTARSLAKYIETPGQDYREFN